MRNYKIWGAVFLFFVLVWIGRTSLMTYRLSGERAKAKYELEMRIERGAEQPDKGQKGQWPKMPTVPKKEPVDVWGWVVKIGGGLAGLKTLLDIVDKLRRKKP
jgi:hypothetical protein